MKEPVSRVRRGIGALRRRLPRGLRNVARHTVDSLPPAAQRLFPHTDEHRRWKMQELYKHEAAPLPAAPMVLFWIPGGMELLLHVESSIAAALQLRGYNVHAIICDSPYSACIKREVGDGVPYEKWKEQCAGCIASNRRVLDTMGIPYSSVGDFVSPETRQALWERAQQCTEENILELSHNGVDIGQNVVSSLIRYRRGFAVEIDERVVREYAYSALISAESAQNAIEKFKPSNVVMSHGVYVDWGPALHTALARGVAVTTWKSSYVSARFYFQQVTGSKLDFYRLKDHAWRERAAKPLTADEEKSLRAVLHTRYHQPVAFDVQGLHRNMGEIERFRSQYKLDPTKPVWGIMCHINWDSVADYSPMAYASFDEWVLDTVEHVSKIADVQWLIKIHPVEASHNRQFGVERLVETRFPDLPPHVKLIPAAEPISPHEFFSILDGGVTVYGTPGLELALDGKPVILAGEAHYGGKGFTEDGLDAATYRNLLSRASCIARLTSEQTALARQYAYSVFLERQVPLPVVRDPSRLWWNLQHNKRNHLLPGADPFIDFICERIIDGKDFIMGPKLVELAESDAW